MDSSPAPPAPIQQHCNAMMDCSPSVLALVRRVTLLLPLLPRLLLKGFNNIDKLVVSFSGSASGQGD